MRKQKQKAVSHRTPQESQQAVRNSIEELKFLNEGYDDDKIFLAGTIAQTVDRLVRGELLRTKVRRSLKFTSLISEPDPKNLMPHISAFIIRMGPHDEKKEVAEIKFLPVLNADNETSLKKFGEWWEQTPIFMEGAAGRSNMIPLSNKDQIPFEKRKRLSRLRLLNRTRNEIGAHFDQEISEDFAFAWKWTRLVGFQYEWPSGNVWSALKNPDHFHYLNTPADAMIRTVSEELVLSSAKWEFD